MSNPSYVGEDPYGMVKKNKAEIMHLFRGIMQLAGIDANTPDTQRTPERFWEVLCVATRGYDMEVSVDRCYDDCADEDYPVMRMSSGIPFISFCEHHWMPFIGTCDVAYIPGGRVTGMSKIPQVVNKYANRFQNQERMTEQIAEELWTKISPAPMGVYVVTRGVHTCERVEGYIREGPYICSAVRGVFSLDVNPREEALRLLGMKGGTI